MESDSQSTSDSTTAATTNVNATTHRSVNVQKITSLSNQLASSTSAASNSNNSRNLSLAQLWSQCASPVAYTSSVATGAMIDLVCQDALDWSEALQGFENALSTAQGQALTNMIHSLSNLIISAAEMTSGSNKSKTHTSKSVFATKNNRHPFIALISTNTQVETILFTEIDRILDHLPDSSQYRIAALDILSPFLDFCLLDRHERTLIVSSATVLWISKTLNACVFDEDLRSFVTHLLDYLCSVPTRFPLDRSQPSATLQTSLRTLVDFYCLPSTQLALDAEYKAECGGRILLALLSWMADLRRYGLPTFPLMLTTQALFRSRKGYTAPSLSFNILWPLLSFLLMNSPTVDEQRVLVSWMHAVLTTTDEHVDAMMANLAFLPIFQVMGESQSEDITKKCADILQKLETISKTIDATLVAEIDLRANSGVAAMIQTEVAHLRRNWISSESEQEQDEEAANGGETLFSLGDDDTFASLILTTYMFHPDESKRIEAMTRQAQVEEGRLVTLVLFIYLLRVDSSPLVKLHLLQEAIPSLITSKDEIVTAKVLRTILTLIHGVPNAPSGAKIMNTHMGAVGVRILFLIWKRQPRVWKTLRHVIHSWVESRPRLFKTPLKGEPEYDMEVAVLATIRDICAFDAAGYAEVLIPFLANLLGSVELYASSICTIIETMNLTVDAHVVEPRAAWNVLLCHVGEHALKTMHPGMLQEMCAFYRIVGSRSEDTQVYLDLREAVLTNYIQPLLTSHDPEVLAAALKALGSFTAPEIASVLPTESPSLYIRELILEANDALVLDEYSFILEKLVRFELSNMRRGLFKEAASKKVVDAASGTQELDRLQGVLSVVAGNILQKWQSGDVNPGHRIGYALSSLLCSAVIENPVDIVSEDGSAKAIRARQSYRNVMMAVKDVALTDHLIERISALEGWTTLFDNMWVPNDDVETQTIAETLIADLYKKITDGYVPAHCANALFAITGIILSLHRHSHPASTVQSSALAKQLLQNFVRPETMSDVGGSDEVQFAVLVSLSFITPLAAVDEKLVASVLSVFTDSLDDDPVSSNGSSDISSWASFGAGWAFCNLLAGLVGSPTKTVELNAICNDTLLRLLTIFELNTASFALTLGLLMAFPRLSVAIVSSTSPGNRSGQTSNEAAAIQKTKEMSRHDLEGFLDNQQQVLSSQKLARLLGAPWIIAFSDRTDTSPEERQSDTDLLDRALLAATGRRDLQPHLVHFTVPFCHMIHTNLDVRNPASSEISLLTGRIHSLVNLIRITPTSAARHTAVIALGSLFGINWCQGPTVTSVGNHGLFSYLTTSTNPAAMASVTNSALSTLTELSGLFISIAAGGGGGATGDVAAAAGAGAGAVFATILPSSKVTPNPKSMLMLQDLKAGRLSALVLGHIACHFQRLGQVDTGKVIGTSSEPKDYGRLQVSTSWLRALWDGLWEPLQMGTVQRTQKSYTKSLELLLYTVHSLPTPLPAVNWFPLLTQLMTFEPSLMGPAIQMASKHATTSTSLMEFLIMSLSNFKVNSQPLPSVCDDGEEPVSAEELFVGEEGLGRILTLGGLPLLIVGEDQALAELDKVRGLDGLAKKVALPGSRVVDLVEKLFKVLFFNADGAIKTEEDTEVKVLQLVFLDTLSHHMRRPRSTATGSSRAKSSQPAMSDDAKELLGELRAVVLRVFYQVSSTRFLAGQRVLRRLADLSLMSVSHLDVAQLHLSVSVVDQPDAGARVLNDAVGIASLYRAGYLTSQQEGRLTQVAQSALLIISSDFVESADRRLAESAISILLYAMNAGVGERPAKPASEAQQRRTNTLRLTWLQRILDLLVLLSSQLEVYTNGLTLLLGGAVLLWWEDPTECISSLQTFGSTPVPTSGSHGGAAVRADDAEALLLSMADDHEYHQESGTGVLTMDDNILEDDMFEQWHSRFQQSVSLVTVVAGEEGDHKDEHRHRAVKDRLSLILPDIVMTARAASATTSVSSSASDNQIASRLLRMALDPQMDASQRQFLIVLLRRMEELVPGGQSWILK
ncbi:hypothetical protein BGZ95_006099 [Linnemannia exigua]|uniref:DUF3730 domain-containing protein n=1 Tax=Linnemannia exigua TaxID=604196 RepID=A0AAD4DGP0_9FUNG|nr:hypothetical protein BGZ95_006099 [Linnemannia exigua]